MKEPGRRTAAGAGYSWRPAERATWAPGCRNLFLGDDDVLLAQAGTRRLAPRPGSIAHLFNPKPRLLVRLANKVLVDGDPGLRAVGSLDPREVAVLMQKALPRLAALNQGQRLLVEQEDGVHGPASWFQHSADLVEVVPSVVGNQMGEQRV